MKIEEAKLKIETKMKGLVEADPHIKNAYLLVHSDNRKIHWNMAYGQTGNFKSTPEQPYHTASIAKSFTSILIAILEREGKVRYDDPISKYLPESIVKDLHLFKGTDYSNEIRVEHLVSNRSGLPDFYEDKPKEGPTFQDMLLNEPDKAWTPHETIQWSKEKLTPKFVPGKKVHYTNTGFNLLGLIIEKVTTKAYHEVLHEYIFNPLKMKESYLLSYSKPAYRSDHPIATVNLKSQDILVEEHRSLMSNFAGGQTASTSEDLLIFMKALVNNQLIPQNSLDKMMDWKKLWVGVDYGYGLMRVRMFPKKYNVWGHLGSIGSFMLYNPTLDVYIIGNFNKSGYLTKSMRFIYNILQTIDKIKE
ncbi:hypothetical protein GCM10008967_36070 [Bacillus carboniphilus]|uniref:Beta-lactamase-related domain-containing protein n=1 Tax=Bacillus carboniphilus TaxID=86663 RepID=A0ABP3GD42_9BACI